MKLSDKYYTGREVQRLLGITEPRLRTLVANKQLTKQFPPGRKTAVYLKAEVHAFAEKWEAFLLAKEPIQTSFAVAKPEDMQSEYEFAQRVYGTSITVEQRQAWLAKNPEFDFIVKRDNEVVAYLTLLPLKHDVVEAFMEGKIRGKNITPDDVETFEPNKPIECIIMGTATDPDVSETTRTYYMLVLIRGIMQELKKLGARGVTITKVYGTSESPTGIAMALHLGMDEIKPRLGKRLKFVLDVDQSESFLLKDYKTELAKWKKNQEKQTKPTGNNAV
jgi:hypothetical protein